MHLWLSGVSPGAHGGASLKGPAPPPPPPPVPRLRGLQAASLFPAAKPGSPLRLCSLHRSTWFHPKNRTFMLFKKTPFNCWRLDRQISMYLRGEHCDPAKHCIAQKAENCGICHLTQQDPEVDGAQLGRSAADPPPPTPGCCGLGSRCWLGNLFLGWRGGLCLPGLWGIRAPR